MLSSWSALHRRRRDSAGGRRRPPSAAPASKLKVEATYAPTAIHGVSHWRPDRRLCSAAASMPAAPATPSRPSGCIRCAACLKQMLSCGIPYAHLAGKHPSLASILTLTRRTAGCAVAEGCGKSGSLMPRGRLNRRQRRNACSSSAATAAQQRGRCGLPVSKARENCMQEWRCQEKRWKNQGRGWIHWPLAWLSRATWHASGAHKLRVGIQGRVNLGEGQEFLADKRWKGY